MAKRQMSVLGTGRGESIIGDDYLHVFDGLHAAAPAWRRNSAEALAVLSPAPAPAPVAAAAAALPPQPRGTAAAAAPAAAAAAAAAKDVDAPFTPAIYFVLWASMTMGFIGGFSSTANALIVTNENFLRSFFPDVAVIVAARAARKRPPFPRWCVSNFQQLRAFAAVRFLAHAVGSLLAAVLSRCCGRRASLSAGYVIFLVGLVLQVTAFSLAQMYVGSLVAGLGTGVFLQATLLESAEVAPARTRGGFMACMALGNTFGFSCCVMLFFLKQISHSWYGWRLALGLSGWPALMVLALLPGIPETPESLIQRGKFEAAREALVSIRGPFYQRADEEVMGIWQDAGGTELGQASLLAQVVKQVRLLFSRERLPVLLVTCSCSFIKEAGGKFMVTAAMPPLMSQQFGKFSFIAAVCLGACYVIGAIIAVTLADKAGRRRLLVTSGATGAVGWLLMAGVSSTATRDNFHQLSWAIALLFGIIAVSTGWGLEGLYPVLMTEHHDLATRSAGVSLNIALMALTRVLVAGLSDTLLCRATWRAFMLPACMNIAMLAIAWLLLPEVKRLPLDQVRPAWRRHWLWRRWYIADSKLSRSGRMLPSVQLVAAAAVAAAARPSGRGGDGDGGGSSTPFGGRALPQSPGASRGGLLAPIPSEVPSNGSASSAGSGLLARLAAVGRRLSVTLQADASLPTARGAAWLVRQEAQQQRWEKVLADRRGSVCSADSAFAIAAAAAAGDSATSRDNSAAQLLAARERVLTSSRTGGAPSRLAPAAGDGTSDVAPAGAASLDFDLSSPFAAAIVQQGETAAALTAAAAAAAARDDAAAGDWQAALTRAHSRGKQSRRQSGEAL